MKVALFGHFGAGNFGNDGSMEALIRLLRRTDNALEIVCICSNPALVRERLGLETISVTSPPITSRLFASVNRLAFRLPKRLRTLAAAYRGCRGVDALIVPGTGILDDFQDGAFGWPFVLLRWCVAARLRGARVAFVSIGAGPMAGGLSQRFARLAAGRANYRSYRDQVSKDFMQSVGVDVSEDRVYPDIAFDMPSENEAELEASTVCVGLMSYFGWDKNGLDGRAIFEGYIVKITTVVDTLLAEGWRVRLIGGDVCDCQAIERTLQRVDPDGVLREQGRVATPSHHSLADVMKAMAGCDAVIATRYHNVVCAISMGKPTISLGYADKNDVLLTAAGLGAYRHHIERFDPEAVMADCRRLFSERDSLTAAIQAFLDRAAERLMEQERDVSRFLAETRQGAERPARIKRRMAQRQAHAADARGDFHAPRSRLKISARLDAARARVSGRANK